MGASETTKCLHGLPRTDYIEQAFYNCQAIKAFWGDVKQFIYTQTSIQIEFNKQTALFGLSKKDLKNTENERK